MRLQPLLLSIACFALPFTAHAQEAKSVLDLPEGQTIVNLSATERVEIDQDLLIGSLRYEEESKDPTALQNKINEVMKKAVELGKKYPEVKLSTEQYYVYPYDYDPSPETKENIPPEDKTTKPERIWRGQQGLQIKSKKADDLLKLSGELQALGLSMSGLNYTISPELLEQTQESLLEGAIIKLQSKADRTAKALKKSKADLLEMNVDIGGYYPQPMMARMEMASDAGSAKMAAPVAQAGQSEITLTVSAKALLKP